MNAGDQFFAVEGFGQIIIGPKAETLDFVLGIIRTGQNQDRRLYPCQTQLAQDFMPAHIRQVQVLSLIHISEPTRPY